MKGALDAAVQTVNRSIRGSVRRNSFPQIEFSFQLSTLLLSLPRRDFAQVSEATWQTRSPQSNRLLPRCEDTVTTPEAFQSGSALT